MRLGETATGFLTLAVERKVDAQRGNSVAPAVVRARAPESSALMAALRVLPSAKTFRDPPLRSLCAGAFSPHGALRQGAGRIKDAPAVLEHPGARTKGVVP